MSTNTKKKVALYIRVSTSKQALDGFSLEGQKNEGTEFAKKQFGNDLEITTFVDEGVSGKEVTKRHSLNKLLAAVRENSFDAVITYNVTRLSRNLSDSLAIVEEINLYSCRFISLKEGEYGTPHGNLQFNILSSVAQYQREELSENVQMGMKQRAKEGKFNGGSVLGYRSQDKELYIIEEEAEIIRFIFERYVHEGWGTRKISDQLNVLGYRTKRGNHFGQSTVNTILRNPVYKGYIRFNQVTNWNDKRRKGTNDEPIIEKGEHGAIISEELWELANSQLKSRSNNTPRKYSGSFPLTSLAKCPDCGSYMTSAYGTRKKDGSKYRYYVCGKFHNNGKTACNPNRINADKLEQQVFDHLQKAISSPEVVKRITESINKQITSTIKPSSNDQISKLQNKIHKLNSQKERIQEEAISGEGLFTREEAKEKIEAIRSQTKELESMLDEELQMSTDLNPSDTKITEQAVKKQLDEFFMLKESLDYMDFRMLLTSTINSIQISGKSVDHVEFSIITFIPESEDLDGSRLHIKINVKLKDSLLLRALFLPKKFYLLVIRFPFLYLKRPVDLLEENQLHQLVRKGHF